ncbi:hypothetical protein AX16_006221 [Volvariella volvacea WC 439]|nr:hypothetical protein AX16_006221 [Volvariella volvacea WC 439]
MFQSDHHEKFVALQRHEDYYINGGDLYFLVEHYQFRVHRYFFERESAFFRGKLTAPATPGASRQGADMASAIVLDGVRSADFAKFLWVFYNPKFSLYKAPPEDWTAILDLAHRWGFPEVKALAVRELELLLLADIDKIVIYHKYDVDRNLLLPQYVALCLREKPLDLHEGLRLGLETSIMIARARECARQPVQNGLRSPSTIHADQIEMENIVKDLFGLTKTEPAPVPSDIPNGTAAGSANTTPPRKDSGPRDTTSSIKPTAAAPLNATAAATSIMESIKSTPATNGDAAPANSLGLTSAPDNNATTTNTTPAPASTDATPKPTSKPTSTPRPSLDTTGTNVAPTTNAPEVDQKGPKDTKEPSEDARKLNTPTADLSNAPPAGDRPSTPNGGKKGRGAPGGWLKRNGGN